MANGQELPVIVSRRNGVDTPLLDIVENHKVNSDSLAVLTEIPYEYQGVRVKDSGGVYLKEIKQGVPEINQYKVNYLNRFVYFHSSNVGKEYTFEYAGTGLIYLSTDSIYTSQEDGIVTETLKSLTDEAAVNSRHAREQGDYAKTQGDYAKFEGDRVDDAINQYNDDERKRKENEANRVSAEVVREQNEAERLQNENIRQENEMYRDSSESTRESNESGRASAEQSRSENEQSRINNENTRKSNEQVRESNEQARQQTLSVMDDLIDNTRYVEEWNSATDYSKNNIVSYLGSSFISLADGNTGNMPDVNRDNLSWGILAKAGDVTRDEFNVVKNDISNHKVNNEPHKYGNRFAWKYNSSTDTLDLVVY